MNTLHALNRTQFLEEASSQEYDLIVIGGGITGAGIALDAALRGLKTLLLEKKDFAFGTSSRSTKLVHGGLRYLKNLEFGLVKELGIERAIVHHLAPHLTVPEKMLTPIVKNGTYGKLLSSIGIGIYDLLAGVKKDERRKMLNAKETATSEPLLRDDIVLGSALYFEYRTDDARLTLEVIKTAVIKGATCLNYVKVNKFTLENGKISGVHAMNELTGESLDFTAKVVVNAAGPWVDEVRGQDEKIVGKRLHLTKGIHLVVPREKLPVRQAVYFDVFDGRMIFVIPRGEITYFGTTDTNYTQSIDQPAVSKEDVIYLINAVNNMFPSIYLSEKDIISGWAGLRPLVHEDGKSASEISRKDEIFISKSGLISIAGGKLTGYRKMAERTVSLVLSKLNRSSNKSNTATQILIGNSFDDYESVKNKISQVEKALASDFKIANLIASRLVHLYGVQVDEILVNFSTYKSTLAPPDALLKAEMKFCVENECIQKLDDFFVRRSGMVYFNPDIVLDKLELGKSWIKEFIPTKTTEELVKECEIILKFINDFRIK